MTDLSKGLECCFEENGRLIFYPADKDIYLSDKNPQELSEIFKILPQCDEVNLEMEDLSSIPNMKFKDGAVVYMGGVEDLPSDLDVSCCAKIDLSGRDLSQIPAQILKENSEFIYSSELQSGTGIDNLYPFINNLDVSRCSSVTINNSDLSNTCNLKFKDGAAVDLSGCTNFPENLDISKCGSINLSRCDLSTIKNIKFCDGAHISLADCKNIPCDIDISHCSSIDLSGCDLAEINNLKFAENAIVNLSGCKNIPENLDISHCKSVNLSQCDLKNIKNPRFKDNSSVNLCMSELPENIDLSNCNTINLSKCDLGNLKNLKFNDGAKVSLSGCANIPQDIDFSKCSSLNISTCDLSQINNIKIRNGAKINLQGCKGLPNHLDVSMCKEVWLTPTQVNEINIGNAHVIFGGIGYRKLDFSKLNNFSVCPTVSDDILGNSFMSFNNMQEYIFRDKRQYDNFIKNGGEIPDGVNISYNNNELKEQIKKDWRKAQSLMNNVSKITTSNSSDREALKTKLKQMPERTVKTTYTHLIEPNSSIIVAKPLIIEKIKRQSR